MTAATEALLWWIGGSWTVTLGFLAICAIRDRIVDRRIARGIARDAAIQRHPSSLPLNLTGYDHTLGSDFTQWAKECSE